MDAELKKLLADTLRSHLSDAKLLQLVRTRMSDDMLLAMVYEGERLPGVSAPKVPGRIADEAVLDALRQGATTSAQIRQITGFTVNQLAAAMGRLRGRKQAFMVGQRQFARYALTKEKAKQAVVEAKKAVAS